MPPTIALTTWTRKLMGNSANRRGSMGNMTVCSGLSHTSQLLIRLHSASLNDAKPARMVDSSLIAMPCREAIVFSVTRPGKYFTVTSSSDWFPSSSSMRAMKVTEAVLAASLASVIPMLSFPFCFLMFSKDGIGTLCQVEQGTHQTIGRVEMCLQSRQPGNHHCTVFPWLFW